MKTITTPKPAAKPGQESWFNVPPIFKTGEMVEITNPSGQVINVGKVISLGGCVAGLQTVIVKISA